MVDRIIEGLKTLRVEESYFGVEEIRVGNADTILDSNEVSLSYGTEN